MYVNPGEVFYTVSDYSPAIPIWLGSVNEDLNYNEQKSARGMHSVIPPPALPSNALPPIQPLKSLLVGPLSRSAGFGSAYPTSLLGEVNIFDGQKLGILAPKIAQLGHQYEPVTSDFSVLDWHIPLALVHPRELGYEYTNPVIYFYLPN